MSARLFLVAYDVASPKRWRKVQKLIRRLCQRHQLSVFVCRGTARRIDALERALRVVLDPTEDRLMVLDLGPADTAADKLKSINSITDIVDLGGVLL